ncbi:MAG: PIN domain-containing protein [Microlunatus sp.]
MGLVYLDANVLVPSYPRTLLIMAAPLSDFAVVWSLHAEAEAERHQESGAAPISALRKRFGWDVLVPDGEVELDDTDAKDKPIISAASLAGADLIVTENVKDFGVQDLDRLRMSAVHPDLFLSRRLSTETYRDILGRLAKTRTREPNTATEMHRIETGERLPLLAGRMKHAYPVELASPLKSSPRIAFRGVRCVACVELLTTPSSTLDLCLECRGA